MFLLVGLGPNAPSTVQVSAREALLAADAVYLETYTNLGCTVDEFSSFLGRSVLAAPRSVVETEELLTRAQTQTVALCVHGDGLTATTHSVLLLDCMQRSIPFSVFPNAGVMNTVALTGLELYKFGQTVSIPYPLEHYTPTSYIDKIRENERLGLHTLCLLDIRADEGRFMTVPEGLALLEKYLALPLVIGCARLATPSMLIKAGNPDELRTVAWGANPHCLVIPGHLNAVEEEYVAFWQNQ